MPSNEGDDLVSAQSYGLPREQIGRSLYVLINDRPMAARLAKEIDDLYSAEQDRLAAENADLRAVLLRIADNADVAVRSPDGPARLAWAAIAPWREGDDKGWGSDD